VNVLGASPTTTPTTQVSGWLRKKVVTHERPVEDWTVDGIALRQIVAERASWPGGGLPSEHPPLRDDDFWPRLAVRNLRSLLGEAPGDFPDGRVVLLYCPVCADLGLRRAQHHPHDRSRGGGVA